jgi:hypothetical protein
MPDKSSILKRILVRTGGERWFCSEAEARDAGWRRAYN